MDLLACLCVCVCVYISNMDLQLWARKCNEVLLCGSSNHFAVTADKGPCVVHVLADLSLCVCVCLSNMDLPMWARKCSEVLVRVRCNHFAVTANKGLCVLDGLAGLSLCVCVFVHISNMDFPLWARKCCECLVRFSCNNFAVTAEKGPCVVD
jgi:hypothetical protein